MDAVEPGQMTLDGRGAGVNGAHGTNGESASDEMALNGVDRDDAGTVQQRVHRLDMAIRGAQSNGAPRVSNGTANGTVESDGDSEMA